MVFFIFKLLENVNLILSDFLDSSLFFYIFG
jgi:hypothetical protein